MAPAEADAFQAALPAELRRLDDMPSLGLCLSRMGLRTERDGSREQALALLRDAVATGHATPAAVDRLTVHLVKARDWQEARDALDVVLRQPIASDTMRDRLTRRLRRCERQAS